MKDVLLFFSKMRLNVMKIIDPSSVLFLFWWMFTLHEKAWIQKKIPENGWNLNHHIFKPFKGVMFEPLHPKKGEIRGQLTENGRSNWKRSFFLGPGSNWNSNHQKKMQSAHPKCVGENCGSQVSNYWNQQPTFNASNMLGPQGMFLPKPVAKISQPEDLATKSQGFPWVFRGFGC